MKKSREIFLLGIVAIFILAAFSWQTLAQYECGTLEECQALLAEYEKEIASHEVNISRTQQEEKNLQNKIYVLRQKINKLELEVKKSNIVIGDLGVQIQDTQASIEKTNLKIEQSRERLAEVLRIIYEEDQKSFLEIVLQGETLSDFFENATALGTLSDKNYALLQDIKNLKTGLEQQEGILSQEKQDWEKMVKIQILQKQESQQVKGEQEWLLAETKGKEAEYQKLLAESQAKAQKIRQRIFELVGVPDAPTFGEAYELAKYVESVTGVRPAFLLAVLTQESNIGKNVGQCYLKNPTTGDGVVARTNQAISRVMKPTRDVAPFLATCQEVGRDPYNTLVSCPMSFGYGGAMGPAQFIPSTWAMYKDKVKAITGQPADPWNIRDAFLAAGVLLRDSGAAAQTYNAEWRAAMIYFSGSTNAKYSFYGNSVMAIAAGYTDDIAQLEKYGN